MSSHIPAALRRLVMGRADHRCEYCQLSQAVALHPHEPDHVIPHQHGGATHEDNLALACFRCNRYKGPNVGSLRSSILEPRSGRIISRGMGPGSSL